MWARVKSNHLAADDTSARVQPASSVMVQTDNRHCVTAFDELMQLLSPTSPPAMSLLVRSVHEWKYLESWLHIDRGNPDFVRFARLFFPLERLTADVRFCFHRQKFC